jgi:hypothetical protein
MSDYTIEYAGERVLPVGMRGDAWRAVKVFESSCSVKDSKGAEIDARFSLQYTQEQADADEATKGLATPGARLEAFRSKIAKVRLAEMLDAKGLNAPAEAHPAMTKSEGIAKADLPAKAIEIEG